TRGRSRSGGHRRRLPRSCVSLHANSDVLSVGCQRALRGLKNLEHSHSRLAISERLLPRFHGTQEGQALVAKGLFRREWDLRAAVPNRHRCAVAPIDTLVVDDQLLTQIVETGHLFGADDYQSLLLEGVQPRNEDVGAHAIVKEKIRDRDVSNIRADVGSSAGNHLEGRIAHKAKDDCDVVRGEAPEDVLLATNLAEGEAIGVDIANLSEFAGCDQLAQLHYAGVVLKDMADHEDTAACTCEIDQLAAFLISKREGLLNENVLTCFESPPRQREVRL